MNNATDVCDDMNAEIARDNISPADKEQRAEMMANIILGGNRTEYRRRVTDEERHSEIYQHLENQFYLRWEAKNSEDGISD